MMPTFADLTGYSSTLHTDGLSFLPSMCGTGEQKEHDYLYWEFHEKGGKQALRQGDWKGVRLNVGVPGETVFELYHLASDLHEDKNVAQQYPQRVRQMELLMEQARTPSELFDFGR